MDGRVSIREFLALALGSGLESSGWFEASTNHSDPEGTWMVGSGLESSGWFEPSEPPRTTQIQRELQLSSPDPTIHVPSGSEWFGEVQKIRTTPNSRVLTLPSTFPLDLSGSWRLRTTPNSRVLTLPSTFHLDLSGLGRFGRFEPPGTLEC